MSKYVLQTKQITGKFLAFRESFDIELTERCNNRCIHCYINQPEYDLNRKVCEMSTCHIKAILEQAVDLGYLSVRFTGGEPLLREDFVDLYIFARRIGLKVLIFTNARLVNADLCRLFTRITPGKPIQVSFYGMSSRSYDAVAGVSGAFDDFFKGYNLLREYNIPFFVKMGILPQNRHEINEFEALALSLSAEKKKPGYVMNFDLRARRDDEEKNIRIMRLRSSAEETLAMVTREPEEYIKEMRHFASSLMGLPGDKIFCCGAGNSFSVDAYGNIQMCLLLRHPDTIYPLDQTLHQEKSSGSKLKSLEYALTKFFPRVRSIRSQNPEYLSRCAVCFLKNLCEQCPAKSWEEHGTLDTPVEYFCELAHAQAVYLGLLQVEERSWKLATHTWQSRVQAFISSENNSFHYNTNQLRERKRDGKSKPR